MKNFIADNAPVILISTFVIAAIAVVLASAVTFNVVA